MTASPILCIHRQGALVVKHELSFASRMEAINDPWLRDNLTKQLLASYARLDVPAIMEKARTRWFAGRCACGWVD